METHFPISPRFRKQLARERLAADLHELVGDAELFLDATADDVSEKARAARRRLADGLARAKAAVAEWPQQGRQSVEAAARRADTTVREHTYGVMLAAASLGLLAGFLLTARPAVPRAGK